MPRTKGEVETLLARLDECPAGDLEAQDLDFKDVTRADPRTVARLAVEMAVCMANGGGGTVVFGVADRVVGRDEAIRGVPRELDVNRLRRAVYDSTEPKITPVFEEVSVPEGTGRLLAMHVHPGMPPYTDTAGWGTIRMGKDCKPLTGALRRRLLEESREGDLTAVTINVPTAKWVAASAIEALREAAGREDAPDDLLELGDEDLLDAMGVLRDGRPTLAALLLAGSPAAIREHVPNYDWTHLRMASDTEYSDRMDGNDAIPVALARIVDRIMADNPIETVRSPLYHFEYRTYPEVALREALLNAFCHANYRIASPILVKQHADHIEITNPGGLLGGITPDNILHHDPVTRNHCLVGALARLRLVNRSNLGVRRIYKSLLIEGKAPPHLHDLGDAVRITFRASRISPAFRNFVAEETSKGISHSVDELLLFRHLLREWVVGTPVAAKVCQRTPDGVREILSRMEARGYLDRQGRGRDAYWTLPPTVYDQLSDRGGRERKARDDPQTIRTRVLDLLRERAAEGLEPLANGDLRRITGLDRQQVVRLIHRLKEEGQVTIIGHGRGARYVYTGSRKGISGEMSDVR